MWHAHDGMGWWMVFGGLLWVVFWATVIYVIARLVTEPRERVSDSTARSTVGPDALEVVRRRYAAGEITRDEFLRLTEDLSSDTARTVPREPQPR